MTRTAAPPKPPKWRRQPEARPQQIIEAALEVFGECGLAKTRLQDIAKRAGVSKGTIYLYFPNKEELFREMIRQTAIAAIETGERVTTQGTAAEQLRTVIRGYWHFVRTPAFWTIYRLVIGELHQFPDLAEFYATEVIARGQNLFSGIIRRGIEAGEFRDVDPKVAARMIIAIVIQNGIWRAYPTKVPILCHLHDDEVFREMAHFYLHSLKTSDVACAQADGAPSDPVSFLLSDND
jgi:TetR/AcrR family transcriptional regulator